MRYRLMDILACPICKAFPSQLRSSGRRRGAEAQGESGLRTLLRLQRGLHQPAWQGRPGQGLRNLLQLRPEGGPAHLPQVRSVVSEVIDSIPHMLPDDLRKENEDKEFLTKYAEKIPDKVRTSGLPFHL